MALNKAQNKLVLNFYLDKLQSSTHAINYSVFSYVARSNFHSSRYKYHTTERVSIKTRVFNDMLRGSETSRIEAFAEEFWIWVELKKPTFLYHSPSGSTNLAWLNKYLNCHKFKIRPWYPTPPQQLRCWTSFQKTSQLKPCYLLLAQAQAQKTHKNILQQYLCYLQPSFRGRFCTIFSQDWVYSRN